MLLSNVVVTNSRGSVLDFPLEDAYASGGFLINDIEGLGPVKATLVSSNFANMDGSQHHSARRENRNLVIKLGLDPDYGQMSVQQLRSLAYDFFMPKSSALFQFHLFNKFATSVLDQAFDVEIEGRIETCEPTMFTKDPELTITVICNDPDFVDPNVVVLNGMTVSDLTETPLEYEGNIETGVLFTLLPDRDVSEFSIYHRPSDESLRKIDFSYPLLTGDKLEISSVKGSKYARLTRAGVVRSVLFAISPQSPWFEPQPGVNNVRVYAVGDSIPYEMEYTTKYGGI